MSVHWMRRAGWLLAGALAVLLAGCGGGETVASQLSPSRVISFGDGFSDVGQRGSRYTLNDGSVNIWAQQIAASYGQTLAPVSAGGLSYAAGNARINSKPDAAGNGTTPSVKEQVDAFLATQSFGPLDLVLVGAGIGDIVAETAALKAGTRTQSQLLDNVGAAGRELTAQVRRLVDAGAKYVVVVGSYNLGRSPWAIQTGQQGLLQDASSRLNEGFLVSAVDLGANVLYVDAALYFNLVTSAPNQYSFQDVTNLACVSVDPGPGIGTGANQINSSLCNANTLQPGVDAATFLFADRIYPMPQGHRAFGDYAYQRIRARW